MRADFDVSAQIKHSSSKGTVRENILRDFLAEGRLPTKYGLGSGEIVGRVRDTSRQCDVVVYDKLNGVTLLYDESVQVFPIDCVYGIIEVKSSLSKTEFLDALEKIKAFKGMAPHGTVSQSIMGGFTMTHPRPQPFGMVFAYSLSSNSLDSLVDNLREWEAETPANLWPNYVCVLEAGVIYHHGKPFETCLDSNQITKSTWPLALQHKEDSLFQFYCALHDMCARMQLGPVELRHYYDPALQIGEYIVYGRGVEGQELVSGKETGRTIRITESTIAKVVSWCATNGTSMKYGDVLKKQFGLLPLGMENTAMLNREVFLYNPDNLPGIHEIGTTAINNTEQEPTLNSVFSSSLANVIELVINGQLYVIAMNGFTNADYEKV